MNVFELDEKLPQLTKLTKLSSNLEVGIGYHGLGPLHTLAKRNDHEIVRTQKKCPKVVPRHFQNHVVWSSSVV